MRMWGCGDAHTQRISQQNHRHVSPLWVIKAAFLSTNYDHTHYDKAQCITTTSVFFGAYKMTFNSTQEGTVNSLTESKKRGPGRPRKTPKPQGDGSEFGQPIQSANTNSSVDVEYEKGDDSVVQQIDQFDTTTAPDIELKLPDTTPDIELKLPDTAPNIELKLPDTTPDIELKLPNTARDIDLKLSDTAPDIDLKLPNDEDSLVVPKQPTKIHLIDGEKGGVGKSLFARVVVQYHLDNELPFIAVETDRSNPALAGIYSDVCQFAFFSEDENQLDKADPIYNFALKKSVIVDLPAQAYRPVKNWIVKNNLIELGKEDSVSFYKWFVCDGGYDSLNLLKQTLEEFGDDIQHILVKNMGKCEDWQHLVLDDKLQELLIVKNVIIIDFPKFYHMERNSIDMKRLTFSEALEPVNFHSISRQRIKSFLRASYNAIASLALFGGGL
jgi:hypothetical protein